jgi:hypothetical protein
MKIKLTAGFLIAFISLHFVMGQAHELVHTAVGRFICGCWGERDFNLWTLCEGCYEQNNYAVLSTFAGPAFTFLMIWTGVSFLRTHHSVQQKSFGFALIFANIPFARIFTTATGHGDEVSGLNKVLHNHTNAWVIGLILVLLLSIYPIYKAFITMENKRRAWLLIFFLLMPMMLDMLFVFGIMNNLLQKGVLSNYWILGSPLLVTVFSFTMLLVFIVSRKNMTIHN